MGVALPRVHRLKNRQDFEAVYRQGIRCSTSHLVLRALPPADKAPLLGSTSRESPIAETLIGISVSLKVSKRAVVRNRIKRQIRAALRHLLPQMARGWRLVVSVRPQAVQCEYRQFLQELEQLLADAEVLDGHQRGGLL